MPRSCRRTSAAQSTALRAGAADRWPPTAQPDRPATRYRRRRDRLASLRSAASPPITSASSACRRACEAHAPLAPRSVDAHSRRRLRVAVSARRGAFIDAHRSRADCDALIVGVRGVPIRGRRRAVEVRDRARRRPGAGEHLRQRLRRSAATPSWIRCIPPLSSCRAPRLCPSSRSTSSAAAIRLVPGPKIACTPASRSA